MKSEMSLTLLAPTPEIINLFAGVAVPTTYDAARTYFVNHGYVVDGMGSARLGLDGNTNIFSTSGARGHSAVERSQNKVILTLHSLGCYRSPLMPYGNPPAANTKWRMAA